MKPPGPLYLGSAYYPEDWPLEQIDEDVALMRKAGLNCARVGEFAWSRMEPEEGRYDFTWLHLAVDKLGSAGIGVIMCTPTCTPPAWLSQRYPEILYVREDGRRMTHGARLHYCPNSPVYRQHCARIVKRLAEEFGRDKSVIGWQIDNEVHPSGRNRSCTCPACVRGFQNAMHRKFGTIEKLNATWGTDLWSQTYQSFDQLPVPAIDTWHHPSLLSEWARFASDSYVAYVKEQADVLHQLTTQPVGTDMMPYPFVDYGDMHRALDLVLFNHYNTMENLWQAVFWLDLCRTVKARPFWNTETATCWNGSAAANGYREPGFCRANSWLPIALGGEANLYWLWRQHWSGQELMHGAVVTSQGRPMHIFDEVREIADGFKAAGTFLTTTRPANTGIALHYSHKAAWTFAYQPLVRDFDYGRELLNCAYHPLIGRQLRPDVILPEADLGPYRVVVSSFLAALDDGGLRGRLERWIRDGGTWIAGPLTDVRTLEATKFTHAPYGSLETWAGIRCKYEIPGDPRQFSLRWSDGHESVGSIWYDCLEPVGALVLATYTEGPGKGLAAVTRHKLGKGSIVVLGTMPQAEEFAKLVLSLAKEAGLTPVAEASANLLVVPRTGKGGSGLVLVEIENRPAQINLPGRMTDLLTGKTHQGEVSLEPYSVMVLKGSGKSR